MKNKLLLLSLIHISVFAMVPEVQQMQQDKQENIHNIREETYEHKGEVRQCCECLCELCLNSCGGCIYVGFFLVGYVYAKITGKNPLDGN